MEQLSNISATDTNAESKLKVHSDTMTIMNNIKKEISDDEEITNIVVSGEIKEEIDIEYMEYEKVCYKCEKCEFSTTFFSSFQVHIDSCELSKICSKTSASSGKPKCEICGKVFTRNNNLKQHKKIHTGEKPFACNICSKAFITNNDLQRHIRVHTGEKPFPCTVCSKSFSDRSHVKQHMKIHTGEKAYVCNVCHKAFAQHGGLKQHMSVHTGIKRTKRNHMIRSDFIRTINNRHTSLDSLQPV